MIGFFLIFFGNLGLLAGLRMEVDEVCRLLPGCTFLALVCSIRPSRCFFLQGFLMILGNP